MARGFFSRVAATLIIFGVSVCMPVQAEDNPDPVDRLHDLWNYRDTEGSRERFIALQEEARMSRNEDYLPVLLTQIGRTFSLEGNFEVAQNWIRAAQDETESRESRAWAYVLIESGRVYNSAGDQPEALVYLAEAFRIAELAQDDYLAADAAHMMAIAESLPNQLKWNFIALGIAENSSHPRAQDWRGSVYNNIGWTYFDLGQYEEALGMFEKGVEFRREKRQYRRLQIARWAVARTHRALGNHEFALDQQLKLEEENKESGIQPDAYVIEEIAELYLALEDERAKDYFALAYQLLKDDPYINRAEPERLERVRKLGES